MNLELPKNLVDENIQLDPSQQMALEGMMKEQYACLIGAAGTGKTTTIKALLQRIMETEKNPSLAFVAFTGRAVPQIKRTLPEEFHANCDTIHGLLEYAPVYVERVDDNGELRSVRIFEPQRTAMNPLNITHLFIDEMGMLGIDLSDKLFDALTPQTKVYGIGDINQLPPVQGRSMMGFAMLKWPTFELNRVHRTEENAIIDGAWNILHGKMPEKAEGKVVTMRVHDGSLEAFQQTIGVIQKLHQNGTFEPLRDGLIVPQNVGNIGVKISFDVLLFA